MDADDSPLTLKERVARFFQQFNFNDFITESGELNWKSIMRKGLVVLAIIVVFYLALMFVTRNFFEQFTQRVAGSLTYWGVATVAAIDGMLMAPISADIMFPLIVNAEWSVVHVMVFMGLASSVGGYIGYWIGRLFDKLPPIKHMIDSIPPNVNHMVRRYGVWAVALSGLLPIPFSSICLLAGVLKVPPLQTFLGVLTRIPRMALYYMLFSAGGALVNFF